MFKRLWSLVTGLIDSVVERVQSIATTFVSGVKNFFRPQGILRTPLRAVVDVGAGIALVTIAPVAAVGLAATCFVDSIDTFGRVFSMLGALVAMEFLAVWASWALIPLVAIQFSKVSTRYLENVEKRELQAI